MKIAIIMMQRNEGHLIDFWLHHAKRLADSSSIYILNNGDDDEITKNALLAADRIGVNIINYRDPSSFLRKGEIISEIIQDKKDMYDWFFPLDCDEVVAYRDDRCISSSIQMIERELENAEQRNCNIVRISKGIYNIPYSTYGYEPPSDGSTRQLTRKVAVSSNSNITLDAGFHLYDFANRRDLSIFNTIYQSNLCYIHFHNRPFSDLMRATKEKLKLRINDFYLDTLKAYNGPGSHLIKYFFMNEAEYIHSLPEGNIDLEQVIGCQPTIPYSLS
jgi:hypothetical protein